MRGLKHETEKEANVMPTAEDKPYGVRFTPEQLAWLQQQAHRQDRSIAWLIRRAVQEAMERAARKHKLEHPA